MFAWNIHLLFCFFLPNWPFSLSGDSFFFSDDELYCKLILFIILNLEHVGKTPDKSRFTEFLNADIYRQGQ